MTCLRSASFPSAAGSVAHADSPVETWLVKAGVEAAPLSVVTRPTALGTELRSLAPS